MEGEFSHFLKIFAIKLKLNLVIFGKYIGYKEILSLDWWLEKGIAIVWLFLLLFFNIFLKQTFSWGYSFTVEEKLTVIMN